MNISYNWLKDLIEIDLPAEELAQRLTNVGLTVEAIHPHGGDYVLDVDMTSNRSDCLSHLGVARESRVITGQEFTAETQRRGEAQAETRPVGSVLSMNPDAPPRPSATPPLKGGELKPGSDSSAANLVTIQDPELCHRFTGRIIRNVKIGPSPKWLVDRLETIGERAINNVADITNYVMHELGQPMHSFDLDKLAEKHIVVRRARHGETVKTLDEIERKLDESMLVICDAEKPVAIGGVMGGFDSGINEQTVNVLLEVAFFKRESIRQTSRKLGLATEASYRFERGVDIENLIRASDRATELICELADGEAGEFVDVYPTKFKPNEIESKDISFAVRRLTGLEVSEDDCVRILDALGIKTENQSQIENRKLKIFTAPSWRHDIAIEEDLVEEVARHAGYDKIADELPPAYGAGEFQATEVRERLLRQTLVDQGFDEAISYSFIDTRFDDIFETVPGILDDRSDEKFVTLRDSVIEEAVRMRPSILPGLLDAVRLNFNHQRRDLKLFELGKVFAAKSSKDNLPTERELFSMAVTGGEIHEDRSMSARELDFYDLKGAVEAALDSVGISNAKFVAEDVKHLRKGQSASVSLNGKKVGYLGRLNEEISANYKFKQPVYVAEIDLQTVLEEEEEPVLYTALPKYPSVVRDVSFLVKREVSYASIREAVIDRHVEICRGVAFVDVYEGKGMAEDERSITIRLEYRSDERTLIDEEVDRIHGELVRNLENSLGVKQRF